MLFVVKSKYKGVHQRKNGTWYYRIKKTFEDGSVEYYQKSGFQTEDEAHKARIGHLREIAYKEGYHVTLMRYDFVNEKILKLFKDKNIHMYSIIFYFCGIVSNR